MPDEEGDWRYEVTGDFSSSADADSHSSLPAGTLQCTPPSEGNHGPVRVLDERHFAYADGTPYVPIGTTCQYGWLQEHQEQTLTALRGAPFTKVRLYVPAAAAAYDTLDRFLGELMDIGLEAELVLQCSENTAQTLQAVHLAAVRFSAYRHVWWSLQVPAEQYAFQETLLQLLHESDPYGRLLTLFSSNLLTNYGDHRISHVSLRLHEAFQTSYAAKLHRKPVIADECGCEGNAPTLWGSLPGEELMHRLWESICRGGYAGHGEMLLRTEGRSWHTHGERLGGEVQPRIAFLRALLNEAPSELHYMPEFYDAATIGLDGRYYLQYFGIHHYPSKDLRVPEGRYLVEIIDAWNMTIQPLPEVYGEKLDIRLPARPWHALRVQRLDGSSSAGPVRKDADALRRQAEDNDNFI